MSYLMWLLPLIVLGAALPFAHRMVRPCTRKQPRQAEQAGSSPPMERRRMRPVTFLTDLDDGLLHAFSLAEYRDDTLDHLAPIDGSEPRRRDRLTHSEMHSFMCTKCAYVVYTGDPE